MASYSDFVLKKLYSSMNINKYVYRDGDWITELKNFYWSYKGINEMRRFTITATIYCIYTDLAISKHFCLLFSTFEIGLCTLYMLYIYVCIIGMYVYICGCSCVCIVVLFSWHMVFILMLLLIEKNCANVNLVPKFQKLIELMTIFSEVSMLAERCHLPSKSVKVGTVLYHRWVSWNSDKESGLSKALRCENGKPRSLYFKSLAGLKGTLKPTEASKRRIGAIRKSLKTVDSGVLWRIHRGSAKRTTTKNPE